jgi:hypothetical protein
LAISLLFACSFPASTAKLTDFGQKSEISAIGGESPLFFALLSSKNRKSFDA